MNRYQKAQAAKKAQNKAANKNAKIINLIENYVGNFANEFVNSSEINQKAEYKLSRNASYVLDKIIEAEEIENPKILEKIFTYKGAEDWVKHIASKNGISFQETGLDEKIAKMDSMDQLKLGIFDYIAGHFKMKQGFVMIGNQKVIIKTFVI